MESYERIALCPLTCPGRHLLPPYSFCKHPYHQQSQHLMRASQQANHHFPPQQGIEIFPAQAYHNRPSICWRLNLDFHTCTWQDPPVSKLMKIIESKLTSLYFSPDFYYVDRTWPLYSKTMYIPTCLLWTFSVYAQKSGDSELLKYFHLLKT